MSRELAARITNAPTWAVRKRDDSAMPHVFLNVQTKETLVASSVYGLQLIVPDGIMIPELNDTITID